MCLHDYSFFRCDFFWMREAAFSDVHTDHKVIL